MTGTERIDRAHRPPRPHRRDSLRGLTFRILILVLGATGPLTTSLAGATACTVTLVDCASRTLAPPVGAGLPRRFVAFLGTAAVTPYAALGSAREWARDASGVPETTP